MLLFSPAHTHAGARTLTWIVTRILQERGGKEGWSGQQSLILLELGTCTKHNSGGALSAVVEKKMTARGQWTTPCKYSLPYGGLTFLGFSEVFFFLRAGAFVPERDGIAIILTVGFGYSSLPLLRTFVIRRFVPFWRWLHVRTSDVFGRFCVGGRCWQGMTESGGESGELS